MSTVATPPNVASRLQSRQEVADGTMAFLTVHPSYLLRQPSEAAYAREYAALVKDLIAIREQISSASE